MSFTNPQFLQKSALDIQITYMNASLNQPIPLNEGNAIDGIIESSVEENVEYLPTATGDISAALMAVVVTGKIHLHPASPAMNALQGVTVKQRQAPIVFIPGTINVKSPSGGWSYSFSNVIITSPFVGFDVRKTVGDYTYTFKASLPDTTSLSALTALGLVNLV